jgi:hypothetical protein
MGSSFINCCGPCLFPVYHECCTCDVCCACCTDYCCKHSTLFFVYKEPCIFLITISSFVIYLPFRVSLHVSPHLPLLTGCHFKRKINIIQFIMSDALRYTTIEDARAHGAICGHCNITAAEIKLFICAGCKNQQ